MKQKYILPALFCSTCLLISTGVSAALLPVIFEEEGGDIIKKATGAVGDYNISNPWDVQEGVGNYIYYGRKILGGARGKEQAELEKQQKAALAFQERGGVQNVFHQTMNCLLNDALQISTQNINETVTNQYLESGQTNQLDLLDPFAETSACGEEGVDLKTIIAKQERLRQERGGDKTVCPNPDDITSYCRVSEALLAELQGYSLYLNIKSYHDKSINNGSLVFEPIAPSNAVRGLAQFIPGFSFIGSVNAQEGNKQLHTNYISARNERIESLKLAIPNAQKSVFNALDIYRQYEQSYQEYARQQAIVANIEESLKQLTQMSTVVDTFPEKFINANSRGRQQ